MVVDDDPDGRFLLDHRLRRTFKDCAVIACTSPTEALGMLRAGCVDAIVTDHQFGGESSCDLITQARRRGVACPILVVTASDDPKVQSAAYAAGATKVFMGGRGDFPEFLRQVINRIGKTHGETSNSRVASLRSISPLHQSRRALPTPLLEPDGRVS
jgi:CheY-like chemotaxis protein